MILLSHYFNPGGWHLILIAVCCDTWVGSAIQQDVHAVQFARDVQITMASFMAAVFGHYRQYLKPRACSVSNDDARLDSFDVEGFIELRDEGLTGISMGDVAATRRFLREFRDSQMFERFCRSRETLGILSLQGNLDGRLEGNIFETLVQQSALRVGETVGSTMRSTDDALSHKRNQTHASTVEMTTASEMTTVGDGTPASSESAEAFGTVDCQQLAQDDQLSAAELRAKSAAATELFLASGLVVFYRVESRAMIRSESARDSEALGILEQGEIIKVSNTACHYCYLVPQQPRRDECGLAGGGATSSRWGHARAIRQRLDEYQNFARHKAADQARCVSCCRAFVDRSW